MPGQPPVQGEATVHGGTPAPYGPGAHDGLGANGVLGEPALPGQPAPQEEVAAHDGAPAPYGPGAHDGPPAFDQPAPQGETTPRDGASAPYGPGAHGEPPAFDQPTTQGGATAHNGPGADGTPTAPGEPVLPSQPAPQGEATAHDGAPTPYGPGAHDGPPAFDQLTPQGEGVARDGLGTDAIPSAPGTPPVPGQPVPQGEAAAHDGPPAFDQPIPQGEGLARDGLGTDAIPSAPGTPPVPGQPATQGEATAHGEPPAFDQPAPQGEGVAHEVEGQPVAQERLLTGESPVPGSALPEGEAERHGTGAPGEPLVSEPAAQGYPEAPAIPSVRDLAPDRGVPGEPPVPEQPVPHDGVVAPQESGARDVGADAASPMETRVDLPPVPDDAAVPAEQGVRGEGEEASQWEELQEQHKELPREEPRPEFQPANDVERALLHAAATNDHDLFLQTLADAEVLVPVPEDMDYALRPGKPGFPWQTREIDGTPAVPVYTSPERLIEAEGAATGSVTLSFTSVLRYWPHPNWMLAINSGAPAGGTIVAEQLPGLAAWADQRAARRMAENFEPQNEVEQRLFDAALRRDTDAFFKVLLGAQVLVPADPDTPWGIAPDDPEFPWRPAPVHGRTAIQVFTSLKWMTDAIGSSRFVMPGFLEVVTAWPDGDWSLVLNPGTPVDASLTAEQVRALSGPARVEEPGPDDEPSPVRAAPEAQSPAVPGEPPDAEVEEPLFEPGNRIDQELYEAVLAGDSDAFLRVLLAANVLVPIPQDAPLEVTPIQREFRWEAALRGDDAVQVFTSLVRLREVLPESRFVYADFRELIGSWPHQDWAMLLNPGTRIGASLRGDQVRALSEWAVRVGLVRPLSEVPTTPVPVHEPQAAPESFAAPEPDPTQTVQDVPADEFGVPAAQEPVHEDVAPPVDPQRNGAPARPERLLPPEPEGEPVPQPAIMQKVVPHPHVSWYLEQGYDRIGGFVHPTSDVADLQTPQQLYETLGLLYEGSPFSPDDEGVYVIRWPAYCSGLYRIPFGGRTEEELAAWGDAGWVLETEPFEGTGFAPGSAGTIREYKVDSIRLPYGAEMYHLGADRSERFIAMYDPDRLAWLRPEGAGSGEEQADRRAEG
ncbi:hypothetical protein HNR61_002656 [Actinomadura namibiensis]|uniref:SseB protein N-terminal domain-containing protein n=1 Tax=Actinomadura namibiensis TaxID=182080 RepID=A0A7W3QL13_ACTNM|nr:hypothetical protein [Actinomadura namibiensis]